MPFRPVDLHVAYGKPELLVEAGPGDIEIQVSCTTFGASGVAGGPNYIVGVREKNGPVRGMFVTNNEFSTDLADGDVLWVEAAEELSFTSAIRITGLVRTTSQGQGEAKSDD